MPKKIIGIPAGPGFITCSSLGALYKCGYVTLLELHDRYKGIVRDTKLSDEAVKRMAFGSFFEDAVAQFFCKQMELKVKKVGNGQMAYWRTDMPYFICHPDRLGIGNDGKGRRFALEVKCVSPHAEGWGEDGSSEIPDHYYIQVQGYFACGVPCEVVYVACMKGNAVRIYEILPDQDVIDDIRNRVREAKESFDKGIIPEPENYDEALALLVRKANKEADGIPADEKVISLWSDLITVHKTLKDSEDKEKNLKKEIVSRMGNAPSIIAQDETGKFKDICKLSETHSSFFDEPSLKKDHPEIYEKYTKERVSHSVRFAWPKQKEEA